MNDLRFRENRKSGVYFRKETFKNSAHRNRFIGNKPLNNGSATEGYGFYIEPLASDVTISNNQIMDTRIGDERTQRYGIFKTAGASAVNAEDNEMEGHIDRAGMA